MSQLVSPISEGVMNHSGDLKEEKDGKKIRGRWDNTPGTGPKSQGWDSNFEVASLGPVRSRTGQVVGAKREPVEPGQGNQEARTPGNEG